MIEFEKFLEENEEFSMTFFIESDGIEVLADTYKVENNYVDIYDDIIVISSNNTEITISKKWEVEILPDEFIFTGKNITVDIHII